MFDIAHQQVVLWLQCHRRGKACGARQMHRLGHLPAEKVGKAVMGDLACAGGTIQKPQGFLQWRQGIPAMQLIQVDLPHPQPRQRAIQRPHQMAAGIAKIVRALAHRKAAFGGNHQPGSFGPVRRQPAPDDPFRQTGAVDIGGVDEIAAGGDIVTDQPVRCRLIRLGAKGHAAQTQRCHDRATWPQHPMFHDPFPPAV